MDAHIYRATYHKMIKVFQRENAFISYGYIYVMSPRQESIMPAKTLFCPLKNVEHSYHSSLSNNLHLVV